MVIACAGRGWGRFRRAAGGGGVATLRGMSNVDASVSSVGGASGDGAAGDLPERPGVVWSNPVGPVFRSSLEMVGNTPMLELRNTPSGVCRLFAKLELQNPSGSVKDRIGLEMIEAAERDGRLDASGDPRPTIVEGTAGNTGLALVMVAAQRGYGIKVVVPDKMAQGKIRHLHAMGAEVVLARSDVQKGHPDYYQDVAERIARETPNSLYINQFANDDNPRAHERTTGPEIRAQLEAFLRNEAELEGPGRVGSGTVDAFIAGVGTGGTLKGVGGYLKRHNPGVKIIAADPEGSIIEPLVNRGEHVEAGSWLVEGMGEDFVPDTCDVEMLDEAVAVSDRDAFFAARDLLKQEGLLAGSSTGCLLAAARRWCEAQTEPKNVVTLICDQGAKYLDKMFNDFWMIDQGFIERERRNDVSDLVTRRHREMEDYTLKPADPLRQAIKVMQLHSISQMAVVEGGDSVVGIIDESDILLSVTADERAFDDPVSSHMTTRLETVDSRARVEDLMPIFRADRVAIVVNDDGTFEGLVTKIDLINYLRRRLD